MILPVTCHFFTRLSSLVFFFWSIFILPVSAVNFSPQKVEGVPIEIDSKQGITCVEKGRVCTAQGQVRVTHGDTIMNCDTLTATFSLDEKGLPTDLEFLEARGGVQFSTRDKSKGGYARRALYTVRTGYLHLTGGDISLTLDGLHITAHHTMEFFEKEARAVATGKARAQKGDKVLSADTLTATFKKNVSNKTLSLSQVNAEGDVILSTPFTTAQSDSALYTEHTQIARLTGNVRLTRQEGQIEGPYAEMDLKTGHAQILKSPSKNALKGASPLLSQGQRVKVLIRPRHPKTPLE